MAPRRSTRASALTELIILLFPYAMILVGVIVLGELSLGRQEAQKASMLAPQVPGEQTRAGMLAYAFPGGEGDGRRTIEFEEVVDPELDQSYAEEEPVLPYYSPDDIHAGFVRIEHPRAEGTVDLSGGTATVSTRIVTTAEGRYLRDMEIMPDRESDLATVLGDWLTFSLANTRFRFAYGGGRLPMETEAPPGRDLREPFDVGQVRDGERTEGITYYGAARSGQDHGSHRPADWAPFGSPHILFGELRVLDFVDDGRSATAMDLPMPEPVLDAAPSMSPQVRDELWDVMNTLDPEEWRPLGGTE